MTDRSSDEPLPNRYPAAIEFRLLGPLEVVRGGGPVALGGRRQRSALALLLLNAGRVVPVERLADDLYAGAAPATAVTQVQRQISDLRRLLPEARLETVSPGYVLRLDAGQLDLHRFERLVEQGGVELERGDAAGARAILREALELWRGPALADLADEPFARSAVGRLEELRLAALERRLDADLALGRAADVVPELEELVAANPLRERLIEQLMLALYRAGRQADALAAYRAQRERLAEELGLEPGPALRRLEAAILQQDPGLAGETQREAPSVVVAVALEHQPSATLAELAPGETREAVLLQLVATEASLTAASLALAEQGAKLDGAVRTAAFVAVDWIEDVLRFAAAYDAALVLVDAPAGLAEPLPGALLEQSSADVGLVFRGDAGLTAGAIYVPFGGGEHDWSALELAAAVARTGNRALRLVGTAASSGGRRDASRLLADASLAVQRTFDVSSAPVLAPVTPQAVLAVVDDAALVVAGVGSRWRTEGVGEVRRALVADATPPVVLVHRGPRPGLLAPRESRTRFTWSLQY
jgi:DNA-binding SARP family transcriptional activator